MTGCVFETHASFEQHDLSRLQLQIQIQSLQAQLAQRPALESVQALEKEYTNLELILQGTQRENERCMADLERYVLPASRCA